jgi:hypothetical protein
MPDYKYIIKFKNDKSICTTIDNYLFTDITDYKTPKGLMQINTDTIINLECVEYIIKEKESIDEELGRKIILIREHILKFNTMERQEWGAMIQKGVQPIDMKKRKYFLDKDNSCLIDRGPSSDTTQFCIMAKIKL